MELLHDAEFWTGLALLVFLALMLALGVHKAVAKALDSKVAKIQGDLDEARKLREEAQALLASLKTQREQTEKLAGEMLANAKVKAAAEAAERQAVEEAKLNARLNAAETEIRSARDQAMGNVKTIAVETAQAIIEKLTGQAASAADVESASAGAK